MANLSEQQVLGMLFDPDFDSGGESDIDEDAAFPLPQLDEIEHSPSPPPESPLQNLSHHLKWNRGREEGGGAEVEVGAEVGAEVEGGEGGQVNLVLEIDHHSQVCTIK